MTRGNESSTPKTKTPLNKDLTNSQVQTPTPQASNNTHIKDRNRNTKKRPRQESPEMNTSPPTVTKASETEDMKENKQNSTFPPYIITFKNSQPSEQRTDRNLIEQLILEWKNKNGFELDITGRYGHEKCLLIFANDETTFEELFNQVKWPEKITEHNYELKVPRILPAAYSLVIQQFFNSWNVNEVLEELKVNYPSLINLTRMQLNNNKHLNIVRADFCSLQQVNQILKEGRITIGHMKNTVKKYYPPAKISKCMRCFSHYHSTKGCNSPAQLCIRCGTDHPFNKNCQNQIKCANCGQDHYAGHSACPEVQQIRKQISQNQKVKRAQLIISQEQEQQLQNNNNNQAFLPLTSTPQQHQQRSQENFPPRPGTYAAALRTNQQQPSHGINFRSNSIENLLQSFTNKIEHRLQQLEERLINQVIEMDKKIDNLNGITNELETIIFESILPAIKTIQKYALNNSRNSTARDELSRWTDKINNVIMKKDTNNTSIELTNTNDTQKKRTTRTKPKVVNTTENNDSE